VNSQIVILSKTRPHRSGPYTYTVLYDTQKDAITHVAGVNDGDLMPQRDTEVRIQDSIICLRKRGYKVSLLGTKFYAIQWTRVVDGYPVEWAFSQYKIQKQPDGEIHAKCCEPDEDFVEKIMKILGLWR